jgi:regulator of replication initiation timing
MKSVTALQVQMKTIKKQIAQAKRKRAKVVKQVRKLCKEHEIKPSELKGVLDDGTMKKATKKRKKKRATKKKTTPVKDKLTFQN